jgi:hypothetical protein
MALPPRSHRAARAAPPASPSRRVSTLAIRCAGN